MTTESLTSHWQLIRNRRFRSKDVSSDPLSLQLFLASLLVSWRKGPRRLVKDEQNTEKVDVFIYSFIYMNYMKRAALCYKRSPWQREQGTCALLFTFILLTLLVLGVTSCLWRDVIVCQWVFDLLLNPKLRFPERNVNSTLWGSSSKTHVSLTDTSQLI